MTISRSNKPDSVKRLLLINGSPIRGSNTDILSEEIARGVLAGEMPGDFSEGQSRAGRVPSYAEREEKPDTTWMAETVYLNDLVITPCQSCGVRKDDDICIYHDDLYPVYDKFNTCDAVVIASPVYFDTVSAQLKLFIDRCNCYRPLKEAPDGRLYLENKTWKQRRGMIVLVGGPRQRYDCALTVIKGFFIWTGVKFLDSILYTHDGYDIGSAKRDSDSIAKAFAVGQRIAQP
jgi:multimeric flavodoxin WrbA